ncbi:MAG TPA: hypothetical protein VEI02_03320 [Planctomycetota bacterium]|nr:hypothetical protein [Planctomycetota bacterium]
MIRFRVAVCASVAAFLAGCGGPETPVETYRAYLSAVARGDEALAWTFLSASSRARLEAEAAAFDATAGASLADDERGSEAALRRALSSGPPHHAPAIGVDAVERAEIVEVARTDASATLRVATPEGARTTVLRFEDGGWRVELAGP